MAAHQLSLALVAPSGEIVGTGEQRINVFARLAPSPFAVWSPEPRLRDDLASLGHALSAGEDAIRVFTRLTDAERRWIQQGGRAVFVPSAVEDLATEIPPLRLRARAGTAWDPSRADTFAWYRGDLLPGPLPGAGRFDLSFAGLAARVVLEPHDRHAFETDVIAAMFAGWLHRPAVLAQSLPVGRGRLVVCTLRLLPALAEDPLAAVMMRYLLTVADH
jgi:hypothetical protein